MIIDFHTHTYPDALAAKIISRLSGPSGVKAYTDATSSGLIDSCRKNSIDKAVVLPVATNPEQTRILNQVAITSHEKSDTLISFGAIHPDNADYRLVLTGLKNAGVPGIKLHPIFQRTAFDDLRYMRIVDCACELGLIITVHAGLDINDPTILTSTIPHIRNLLKTTKPEKLVLAHMGGHLCWDEAEDMILEYLSDAPGNKSLYLDTAFCLPSPVASQNIDYEFLSTERFVRLVREIGSDRVLFGTDSPWTDQGPSLTAIRESSLTQKEISRILGENAEDLLML